MEKATARPISAHPGIAWAVILLIAVGGIVLQSIDLAGAQAVDEVEGTAAPIRQADGLGDSAMVTVQGRPVLGLMQWVGDSREIDALIANAQPVQRIRGWILKATRDRDVALEGLAALAREQGDETPAGAAALRAAAAIAGDEQVDHAQLREELGWFGDLAIAVGTPGEALREMQRDASAMLLVLLAGIGFVALAALTGLVLGIIALVRIGGGVLRSALGPSDPVHGLYAEAFAVWLILLNVLSILGALISESLDVTVFTSLLVLFPATLAALWWPSLRGSNLRRTAADIGLTRGRGLLREVGAGITGWMCMLPLQGAGIACTWVLMMLAGVSEGDTDAPTHPIIDALGDPLAVISAFVVAVVLAPLVEETAFRGLLYRQLRSVGPLRRGAVGVLGSALLTGLLFAAIHPQGWMAIPSLMSIAIALALAREWRGSLAAPMIMHGINNGLAVTALLIIIKA